MSDDRESKVVVWGESSLHDEEDDEMYDHPQDYKKETFKQIVSRAIAKKRDGEPLSPKEKWALSQAAKQNKLIAVTGPRKPTLDRIERIVRFQLEEGLEYQEIAQKEGRSPSAISHLVARYQREYRDALKKVSDEALTNANIRRPVVYARLLALYQKAALRAPVVVDEIMNDVNQPGGVRLKAASDASGMFDMGKDLAQTRIAQQKPSQEALDIIKDTIGIMERLKQFSESSKPDIKAEDAEVLNEGDGETLHGGS